MTSMTLISTRAAGRYCTRWRSLMTMRMSSSRVSFHPNRKNRIDVPGRTGTSAWGWRAPTDGRSAPTPFRTASAEMVEFAGPDAADERCPLVAGEPQRLPARVLRIAHADTAPDVRNLDATTAIVAVAALEPAVVWPLSEPHCRTPRTFVATRCRRTRLSFESRPG